MNHVTLPMRDGSTQVDHILVSRYGVFVIETKTLHGWIFGTRMDATWTKINYGRKTVFQNPLRQNYRHVCAVQELLGFLPPEAIRSVVVTCGAVEFKTERPAEVIDVTRLQEFVGKFKDVLMSENRMHLCIGRLEAARLAISDQTDVEHVERLQRRFGAIDA